MKLTKLASVDNRYTLAVATHHTQTARKWIFQLNGQFRWGVLSDYPDASITALYAIAHAATMLPPGCKLNIQVTNPQMVRIGNRLFHSDSPAFLVSFAQLLPSQNSAWLAVAHLLEQVEVTWKLSDQNSPPLFELISQKAAEKGLTVPA